MPSWNDSEPASGRATTLEPPERLLKRLFARARRAASAYPSSVAELPERADEPFDRGEIVDLDRR